jgi:hypothetical protein
MAHLPVIANVWRVTFEFNEAHGISPRNVMHFLDSGGDRTADGVFNAINDNLPSGGLWGPVGDEYTVQQLGIIKLDGTSATTFHPTDTSAKWQGGVGGDIIPNGAAVVKLQTGLRGREHRGRVFLGPLSEGAQADGYIGSTIQSDTTSDWVAFTNALVGLGTPMPLVVASYRHATAAQVIDVGCRHHIGSMRRRLKAQPL